MNKRLLNKIKSLNEKEPFLLTVTVFKNKRAKEMETFLLSNKFPPEDLESTGEAIGNLIDEQMDKHLKSIV